MTPAINNSIRLIASMLCVLVISLGGGVYAASIPVTATLNPIVDGLRTPLKMALDSDGSIYVADPRSGGVVQLDQYGRSQQVIKTTKPANAVALLDSTKSSIKNGKILVGQGDYVAVLDQNGMEVARLGSGAGQFVNATGIAVDTNGNIYVADAGAYNVKKFSSSGAYLSVFGSSGTGNGQFQLPGGIAVDLSSNQIAVVDTTRANIQFFSSTGIYLKTIGGVSDYLRDSKGNIVFDSRHRATMVYGPTFSYPATVTFEYANGVLSRMYVVDTFQGYVEALDPAATLDKQLLAYVGSYGDKNGNLLTPSDGVFDKVNKRLLVANGLSNIVSFGIDGGQNPVFNGVPPVLTVDQPVITVNSPSVVLNGTVDAGCTVAASVDTAAQVGAVSLPTASTWTVPVDSLNPGKNVVSITARDNYGSTTTKTATIQFVPPTAALTMGLYPSLTAQPSLVLSGTVDAGSYVYVGNAASGISGQANVTGMAWSYALALTEGLNTITITASRTGASTAFKTISITLDTQAPLLTVSALPDGSSTANQVQNISGTASDPNLASVTVNGNAVSVNNDGSFSYPLSLVKGVNSITVVASDSLGNQSVNNRTIKFNPDIPRITVTTPVDGSYTNAQDLTITGSVDSAVSLTVNDVPANLVPNPNGGMDWSATVRLVPAPLTNTLIIAATNEVGTVGRDKRTITYYADKPVISINDPSQDIAFNKPGLTIRGTVSDKIGIKAVKATLNGNGKLLDKDVVLVNGEFSLFADFTAEGTYTVTVTATNLASSVLQAQRSIVYDVTPPALTVDPVQVPYPSALAGTVEAGAGIVVKDDNTGCAFTVAVTGERWNADLSGCTYNPSTLVIKAVDSAQNVTVKGINPPVPDGDMDGDGKVTVADALAVIRLVVSNQKPTDKQLAHGDIGPLLNGKINPKGRLAVIDAILILRKALGLPSWQ